MEINPTNPSLQQPPPINQINQPNPQQGDTGGSRPPEAADSGNGASPAYVLELSAQTRETTAPEQAEPSEPARAGQPSVAREPGQEAGNQGGGRIDTFV